MSSPPHTLACLAQEALWSLSAPGAGAPQAERVSCPPGTAGVALDFTGAAQATQGASPSYIAINPGPGSERRLGLNWDLSFLAAQGWIKKRKPNKAVYEMGALEGLRL
jgi:hypothetical protein